MRKRKLLVITCSFVLILGAAFLLARYQSSGIELRRWEVSLEPHHYDLIDVEPFLTYKGKAYIRYEMTGNDKALRGNYLGEVLPHDMVKGWKKGDPYPDFVGFFSGKVYTVRGYDPDYLLAVDTDAHGLEIYYCPRLERIRNGRDILGKQFHLREKMKTLIVHVPISDDEVETRQIDVDACRNLMEQVVKECMRARFEVIDPADYPQERWFSIADEYGLPVRLLLREQGYIQVIPLYERETICLKLKDSTYQQLSDFLEDTSNWSVIPQEAE